MLMPLLVRLMILQVQVADGVVTELADGIQDRGGILEQIGSGRLAIDQKTHLPDLYIDPVHGIFSLAASSLALSEQESWDHRCAVSSP